MSSAEAQSAEATETNRELLSDHAVVAEYTGTKPGREPMLRVFPPRPAKMWAEFKVIEVGHPYFLTPSLLTPFLISSEVSLSLRLSPLSPSLRLSRRCWVVMKRMGLNEHVAAACFAMGSAPTHIFIFISYLHSILCLFQHVAYCAVCTLPTCVIICSRACSVHTLRKAWPIW